MNWNRIWNASKKPLKITGYVLAGLATGALIALIAWPLVESLAGMLGYAL